ncbi:flagellar basal body P-ring formation protein FlgA [bacterium]|nr:flagellar basal body P-ring formation protein FlgA [bacterium]
MRRLVLVLMLLAPPALADSMIATRTIHALSVIGPDDVAMVAADIPGAMTKLDDAIGQEAKVTLYAGRPIVEGDLGAPALVKRSQLVTLVFQADGLTIHTDGRALERGASGDLIHVMNLSSHLTVSGAVAPDGSVVVGPKSKD